MAGIEVSSAVSSRLGRLPRMVEPVLGWAAVTAVLGLVMLGQSTGEPAIAAGWRVAVAFVVLAAFAVTLRLVFAEVVTTETGADPSQGWRRYRPVLEYGVFLLAAVALVVVLVRSATPGLVLDRHRNLVLFAIVLLILVVAIVPGYDRFSIPQWLFFGAFALLAMIFLHHTLAADLASEGARWPIWAVAIAAICLFVVPRTIAPDAVLWAIAVVAAVTVVLGLRAVLVGEYTIGGLEVLVYDAPRGVFAWAGVPPVRSIFPNINVFGLVTLAGVVSAVAIVHRSVVAQRYVLAGAAAVLVPLSGLGLIFSHSRASWIGAGIGVAVYLGVVAAGRRFLPVIAALGALAFVAGVLGGHTGQIPLEAEWYEEHWTSNLAGRIQLWQASVAAVRADPSLFGAGIVSTELYIEPYLEDRGAADPHNSYASMLIRTGLVGFLAYLGIVLGSILYGLWHRHTVDLGFFALAIGWAIHMMFEEYTILQWTPPAVLAALAFGYVVFARRRATAEAA